MATIEKSTEKGYRIYWRLYFPSGASKIKYKTSQSKYILQELLPDVMKIETLSRRQDISPQDLSRALALRIITRDELNRFGIKAPDMEIRYLSDLRQDYENKSKIETSAKSHQANLYRANKIEEWFQSYPVSKITPEIIETYRTERQKTVTAITINQDLKVLRKYIDIAVNKNWIPNNPAREIKLMREPKNRVPRCLYPQELTILWKNLPKFKHFLYGEFEFIVKVLLYTGLRRGELCDLTSDRIKIHLRQIHVAGKGNKTRIVGIHKDLMKDFKKRVKQPHVLPHKIRPESISRAFRIFLRKIGLPQPLNLHSLRHSYISYLLEKGVPTKRVKELAGHFSLSVTDRYTHALPKDKVDEDVLDFKTV